MSFEDAMDHPSLLSFDEVIGSPSYLLQFVSLWSLPLWIYSPLQYLALAGWWTGKFSPSKNYRHIVNVAASQHQPILEADTDLQMPHR